MSTFVSPTDVEPATLVRSATINDLDAAVGTAFALLPTEDNLTRGTTTYAVDTGTANTYVVALPHAPSGYVDGLRVTFRTPNANTGASTINVNGLGAKAIRLSSSGVLAAGDIPAGAPLELFYSTATGFFHLAPNSTAASISATASAAAASTSASNALTSENNAAASYDSFDDRYLGSKAADPTLDNDGDALLTGALYWNTSGTPTMKVYNGASWQNMGLETSASSVTNTPAGNVAATNVQAAIDELDTEKAKISTNTFTGVQNEAHGADVASAGTINLTTATGNLVDVTGTTTITAITLLEGAERTVRFTGALTLTNGASLVLPGGANITTASGDFAIFRGYGSGVVRCTNYTRGDGNALVSTSSGLVFLSTTTVSGVATADIEWTPGDYDVYVIVASNIQAVTDGSSFRCRYKIGGSYLTTSGYATSIKAETIGTLPTLSGLTSQAFATLGYPTRTWSTGGGANRGSLHLTVNNAALSGAATTHANCLYPTTVTAMAACTTDSYHQTQGALTGIRFYFSAGNIDTATFALYGMRKS